jgi:uncharacterized cupredoxin-like copper-binding protein
VNEVKQVRNVLLAGVVGASFLAPIYLTPVYAVAKAQAVQSVQSVSSGTAKIFATAAQTFTNPGTALAIATKGVNSFYVENGGTLSTQAFNMQISLSAALNSLIRCNVGVSFTGTGTCATGSPTTITITANTLTTLTVTFAPSTWYEFQVNAKSPSTIDTSVLSSQIVSQIINS